jgi:hypothetical protein
VDVVVPRRCEAGRVGEAYGGGNDIADGVELVAEEEEPERLAFVAPSDGNS